MFRTREEIEKDYIEADDQIETDIMLEIFLDIRELLMKANETEKDREIRGLIKGVKDIKLPLSWSKTPPPWF